jgi:hypothetical protein
MHHENVTVLQDTREALQQTQNSIKTPSLPSSIAIGATLSSCRTSLVTGEQSSHHTPSYSFKYAAVGVKCLEEAYLSLAEGTCRGGSED